MTCTMLSLSRGCCEFRGRWGHASALWSAVPYRLFGTGGAESLQQRKYLPIVSRCWVRVLRAFASSSTVSFTLISLQVQSIYLSQSFVFFAAYLALNQCKLFYSGGIATIPWKLLCSPLAPPPKVAPASFLAWR